MLLRLDAKYTKELADAKAENDALRDDAAAGRRRLHISSLVSHAQPPRLRRIMQLSDWQTPLNGIIFTLRERLITMQKQLEGTQKYINDIDRVALYRWQPIIIVSNTHALPAEYKCLIIKLEQSIYECLLGFCFNNTFCAATNFGCIYAFLPNSRNEEMMGDGFPGATAAGLF